MSNENNIQLGFTADTTDAEQGVARVETRLGAMAQKAADAGKKASEGIDKIGDSATKASEKVEVANKKFEASIKRATDLQNALAAGPRGSAGFIEARAQQAGADVGALKPMLEQLRAVEAAQKGATVAVVAGTASINTLGMSAKQTAFALRGIPAQFTDIFTSLAAGQAPLTVLLQQGGQLKDMFGGIGPAAKALGGYVVGLINPFSLVAVAVGVAALAFHEGSKELRGFENAVTLTGNAIGVSASQFTQMRDSIAGIATKGKAAEVLTEIAASGKIAGDQVKGIAEAAILMEKATGQAISKTVAQFEDLAKSPADAAAKLNEQYNFLTTSVYKQIRALEDQGQKIDAVNLAEQTYADALKGRATTVIENAGLMERAWRGVTGAAKGAWDAMLGIGRDVSTADRLSKVQADIAKASGPFDASAFGGNAESRARLAGNKEIEKNLLRMLEIEQRNTYEKAEQNRLNQLGIAFDKQGDEFKTKTAKRNEEVRKAEIEGQQLIKAGLLTEAELRQRISDIRAKFKESGAAGAGQSEVAGIRARALAEQSNIERLRAQIAEPDRAKDMVKQTEAEKLVLKIQEELKTSITGVSRAQKELALTAAQGLAVKEKESAALEKQVKGLLAAHDAYDKLVESTGKQADSIRQQAIDTEAANSAFGKSKTAIEEMALAQIKSNLAEADSSDSFSPAYVAALSEKVNAQERYVEALKQTEIKQLTLSNSEWARVTIEETKTLQLQASLLGMTQLQREKILGQRQVELELAKRIAEIDKASISEVDKIKLRAEASATAVIAGNNAAAKAVQDEWQRTADQINTSITDALMRGFESGKGIAANLRDTIVNMFKTMVLRPTIQATVQGGLSALGIGGGEGGGIMGIANNASSLNSLFGAGSQALFGGTAGASTASLFGANAVGMAGGDALGSLIALNGQWAGVATGAASAAQAAIAANVALEAGAGVALASGTTAAAAGGAAAAAAPLAAMGPVGWVALAAVAVMSIFGDDIMGGERTNGAKGIEGNFSGSGFRGNSFQEFTESGGWFGSDSSGKDVGALDPAMADKFSQSYAAIQLAAAQAANALGLSADAVSSYSERISLTLTDDAAANEKAITALFTGIGDRMASAVAPGLSAFAKAGEGAGTTLSRLATSLTTANTWLSMLEQTLFNVSLSGGDAASKLADAFGGLDKLSEASKSFYEIYYSEAERAARSQEDIAKALATVNLAIPTTKDELRALAATLDLNTDAGRHAYAVLLSIAPQFAATTDSLAKAATESADALLKKFSDSAKVNFAGLTEALVGVGADTFARTIGLVFENLAKRIQGVIDSIASERTATANAMLQINGPGVMTKDAIQRGIAGTALVTPGNAGLTAAQAALGQADVKVAAESAAVALAKAQAPSTAALDAARAVLNEAKRATDVAQAGVDLFRSYGNGNFNAFMDQAFAGNDLRGTVPNPSGERNAQQVVFNLLDAQRAQAPAQAAYDAALAAFSGAGSVNASLVAEAQAKLTAALAAQAAAVTAARAAQLAYISSLQDFAIDAGKSVVKLGQLREETLKYYEAQKQLADLMGASAANLRNAVSTARNGQLDPAQSLSQQQTAFQTAYSLALATTGATQAGFADKLAAALPGLNTAVMDTASTREEWAKATGTLFAQSEAIAKQLEANAPQNYAADSLAMLGQIDAALAVLDASSKSAEKIIADAVTAGSEKTADGLRAVIAALTGQPVPAFASGGDHGGGLRIVGERGPELEATGPSRIWSASQTAAMLSGGGNGELVQEVRALRQDNAEMRAELRAIAGHTNKSARLLERAMPDGDAIATREAAV